MKFPTPSILSLAALAGISLVTPAFASITMDWVNVGHAGNAADPGTGSLYGAVAYAYQIGKYEVSNAQYGAFLNAVDATGANANGVYNTNMGSNARGGSTETGAYTLSLNTGTITKNSGANVYLPSEDEWYKAAYYDPTPGAGGGDNYWLHATQSDTAPTVASANSTGDITNPGANVANYNNGADWNSLNQRRSS
jgi:formylglycine-generating enzyme required for sulfatase activity